MILLFAVKKHEHVRCEQFHAKTHVLVSAECACSEQFMTNTQSDYVKVGFVTWT